jgi:hypothetical protein
MEDQVVGFLVRMAFLIGESSEKDLQALHQHTMRILAKALSLFGSVPVKLSYLPRLLEVRGGW